MKKMKKLFSLVMALAMVMSLTVAANAQTVGSETEDTPATITIKNASKGVTYYVYKVFGATVNGDKSISYTFAGELPSELSGVFEKVPGSDNVVKKADATNDDAILEAVETYALTTTPVNGADGTVNTDGGEMTFYVPYGYYVIKSNLSTDVKLTVDSTTPNAEVYDKASAQVPHFPTENGKQSDKETVKIGETVTYTVTFNTANWVGEGETAKQVKSYTFTDTLPEFLSDVTVTSVKVKQTGLADVTLTKTFENKTMTIDWVNNNGESLYANGAVIEIVYTARVDGDAAIGTANENKITASWTYTDNSTIPETDKPDAKEDVYTYSFEMVKVNNNDETLANASFSLYTTETGGTPVDLVKVTDNVYRLAIAEGDSKDATENIVTVVTTPADGKITIQGLSNGTYWMEETAAPNGYNKLTAREDVTITNANVTSSATDGFRVVNQTGIELPSTGGIGTTIFTVVGGALMVGAAVLFITKKRSED